MHLFVCRYELVPKVIKEDEFWRNYFYRVSLIKQSFELSNRWEPVTRNASLTLHYCSMTEDNKREKQVSGTHKPVEDSIDTNHPTADHDDEFVSDLHQASSKDIAEADEAMKKLGLTKVCISFPSLLLNFHHSERFWVGSWARGRIEWVWDGWKWWRSCWCWGQSRVGKPDSGNARGWDNKEILNKS